MGINDSGLNDRTQLQMNLVINNSTVETDKQYISRFNTANSINTGSVQINGFIASVTAGQKVKLQVSDTGEPVNIKTGEARLTIKCIRET